MTTAETLRDLGIARSSQSAERLNPEWSSRAYEALCRYIATYKGDFSAEGVRVWATDFLGLVPEPPDKRAWGAILVRAAKENLIKRVGFAAHRDPKRHKGISSVWRAV